MRRKLPIECNRIRAYVVRTDGPEARVLLLKRRGTHLDGTWQQVAGGIKEGETAWQAALREIAEESGLRPGRLYSADLVETYYSVEKDRIYVAPVFVGFVGPDANVKVSDEHYEHEWVTFDEAAKRLPFPHQRDAMAHIRREFVDRAPSELLRINHDRPA
jgi:dATP pyrophosphohydrolase